MHSSVLWTVILLSQRNQSSFKNEFDKSLLASKHLRTLVSSNTLPFYCLYLIGFTFKYIKVYLVPVVWFWTDAAFVSTVKLVFYLPDKELRWRALWLCCGVVKSSQFHVTNKKKEKTSGNVCSLLLFHRLRLQIMRSVSTDTFNSDLVWSRITWPVFFLSQVLKSKWRSLNLVCLKYVPT